MKRIGLFGGSFDPIHFGHLEIAKQSRKQFHLDEIWFVVSANSPFKVGETKTSFADRAEMVGRMIAPYRKFKRCDIEHQLPIPSYSIDTIRRVQRDFPDYSFFWIMGGDQAAQFERWDQWQEILNRVDIIVYPRHEASIADHFLKLTGPMMELSSQAIRQGSSRATAPVVLRYMMAKSLYTETMLSFVSSPKRKAHILSMSQVAQTIGAVHGMNVEQIRCATLMHDFAKEMVIRGADLRSSEEAKPRALWHAPYAAMILSRHYYFYDRQVLRSIRGHVVGSSSSNLGKLVYIADKVDPLRGYDSSSSIALAKQDINRGFRRVKHDALVFERKKHDR